MLGHGAEGRRRVRPGDHHYDDQAPELEEEVGGAEDPGRDRGEDSPAAALEWRECGSRFQCAEMEVPLDYDQPDGPTITIALNRRPAADPERRLGALAFNPGGPGASGKEIVTYLLLPEEVRNRFDIIGFDPRGVGDSDGLDCHTHLQEIYDLDPTMEDQADENTFVDVSQRFVDECEARHADVLPHLGTENVARDLDRIRAALGDEQLNYVGYSYGTSIGQQYARLFPERVRTMILDGVVDQEVDGLTAASDQAAGFELALSNYLDDCASNGCFDDDARTVIDRVVARPETTPIPSSSADRPAGPGVVNLALAYALYSELLWPDLTNALQRADEGDGSGLVDLADAYLNRNADGSYTGVRDLLRGELPRLALARRRRRRLRRRQGGREGESDLRRGHRHRLRPLRPLADAAPAAPAGG